MLRIVADLGNSRMKWARLDCDGLPTASVALPPEDPATWQAVWDEWHAAPGTRSEWAVASVNPPLADRLANFLGSRGVLGTTWFRTAAEVPIPMDVEGAETGGADRALAVLAASRLMPAGRPGLVVSCGTAITVERVNAAGVWEGGVIAPGLYLSARALHLLTAQLPLIRPDRSAPSWGRGTIPSLEAGIFWGTVGAVKELLARQTFGDGRSPWVVWTGGDAIQLSPPVCGGRDQVVPDLVLRGIAEAAFSGARGISP